MINFDEVDCENAAELKTVLTAGIEVKEKKHFQEMIPVCPFDVILTCSANDKRSFFIKQLKEMAEGSLDEELIGYKLSHTHMCLGSKVHIESFYEMSFLFYRTAIANRLAFNILREMKKKLEYQIEKDNILFYGYVNCTPCQGHF